MNNDIAFTTSISTIKKEDTRLGIWIKKEFETEKVRHFLVDISIENKDLLTVYENACIGLDINLIDSSTEDALKYRNQVFDILTSPKVKNYIENNGYFNNLVYLNGKVVKEKYESIDQVLPIIRKEYPFEEKTKELMSEEDRYETLRLQFEESDNKSVEESIKN